MNSSSEIIIRKPDIPRRDVRSTSINGEGEKLSTYYKVMKYCIALSDAQQKKTAIHVAVNGTFRQSLFGIIAGFWRRSWLLMYSGNMASRTIEITRSTML